jgi:Tfp pilus assembly protein PilN
MIVNVLTGLLIVAVVFAAVELLARWQFAQEEKRQRMLEESWALYRASRAIHDQTAAALQSMLDEARRGRPEAGE